MKYTAEYQWLESYLNNDSFWLEDVLSWDDTINLFLVDSNILSFLITTFFVNTHLFLDSITKMSFLDILFYTETDTLNSSRELFDFTMWDLSSYISSNFFIFQFIFFTDYQDFLLTSSHHAPEINIAIIDYINTYWINYITEYTPSAVFDVYYDSLSSSIFSQITDFFIMFIIFTWLVVIFSQLWNIANWDDLIGFYETRINYWLFSVSKETRIQLEAIFVAFFLYFLYFSMMVLTFDDDQEEVIELVHNYLFYGFLSTILFLFFKSSLHSFILLEPSLVEGRTLAALTNQFRRDLINVVSFCLRLLTLMTRLNIYDMNDDITDSFYIFFADFTDDNYLDNSFISEFGGLFYDEDNDDDQSFFFEDEIDLTNDFFTTYFISWGKLFFFVFFILEEVVRVSLALYIVYSIVLELQSINRTYVEDNFFGWKRYNSFNNNSFKINGIK